RNLRNPSSLECARGPLASNSIVFVPRGEATKNDRVLPAMLGGSAKRAPSGTRTSSGEDGGAGVEGAGVDLANRFFILPSMSSPGLTLELSGGVAVRLE